MLNEFYLARIGLRFLIEHHITSHTANPGFSGIIESKCKPKVYVEKASQEAFGLCQYYLGEAPEIKINQVNHVAAERGKDVTFTYVPGHLQYMLVEVLKNAARASVENNRKYIIVA